MTTVLYLDEEWKVVHEGLEVSELKRLSDGALRFVPNEKFEPVSTSKTTVSKRTKSAPETQR